MRPAGVLLRATPRLRTEGRALLFGSSPPGRSDSKRNRARLMPLFRQRSRGLWSSAAGLAVLWALLTPTASWSAETKTERAARYYHQASQLLKDFRRVPEPELGPKQYQLVAKAFRKVYLISPASSYCDDSLIVEAEMYRKAAARFESEKRRADALKTYRFLAREYPHSKLKPQVLQAIAEMEGREDPQLARNEPPVASPSEAPAVADPAPRKEAVKAPAPSVAEPVPARADSGSPRTQAGTSQKRTVVGVRCPLLVARRFDSHRELISTKRLATGPNG